MEPELIAACDDVVGVLDKYLIPADDSAAGSVFYLKMKGDYHRYRAEVSEGKSKEESTAAAKASYDMAQKMAEEKGLQPTDPIRLGLALNVSGEVVWGCWVVGCLSPCLLTTPPVCVHQCFTTKS